MSAFPTKPADRVAMTCFYLLSAVFVAECLFPRLVAQFLIGLLP